MIKIKISKIWSIVHKDITLLFSDRKSIIILILMPLILSTILGFALKGIFDNTANNFTVKIAVVTEYSEDEQEQFKTDLSSNIIGKAMSKTDLEAIYEACDDLNVEDMIFTSFLDHKDIQNIISYVKADRETALDMLRRQEVASVVIFPKGFIYDLVSNLATPFRNKIEIEVIGSPEATYSSQLVGSVFKSYSNQINNMIIAKNTYFETMMAFNMDMEVMQNFAELFAIFETQLMPDKDSIETLSLPDRPTINSFAYYTVGTAVMFVLFAATWGGKSLLEEKDAYTYQRMLANGIKTSDILMGKFVLVMLIVLLQMTVLIAFSRFVFGINWGNPLTVALLTIAQALALGGLGAFLAAITFKAGNYKLVDAIDSAVIQIMALLGGSYIPIYILPKFLQRFSNWTINGIALKAYKKVMLGYSLTAISQTIYLLAGWGVLLYCLGLVVLHSKEAQHV